MCYYILPRTRSRALVLKTAPRRVPSTSTVLYCPYTAVCCPTSGPMLIVTASTKPQALVFYAAPGPMLIVTISPKLSYSTQPQAPCSFSYPAPAPGAICFASHPARGQFSVFLYSTQTLCPMLLCPTFHQVSISYFLPSISSHAPVSNNQIKVPKRSDPAPSGCRSVCPSYVL